MAETSDVSHDCASFVVDAKYEDLLTTAIDGAKKSILDTLGVSLAASGMEPIASVFVDLAREHGARGECSILGFGIRAPAAMAGLVNGALAYAFDFDDRIPWEAHPDSSDIPAVLAVADLLHALDAYGDPSVGIAATSPTNISAGRTLLKRFAQCAPGSRDSFD